MNHNEDVDKSVTFSERRIAARNRCSREEPRWPIEIAGTEFSGFPGHDFPKLASLTFEGRVAWVDYRFEAFSLAAFERLVAQENESYIWLCVVNLLTSAVDALAHFECFLHRCLAFRQREEPVCPSSYSERNLEPYIHFSCFRVCNFTSPSKRDIEPAVHFHLKKELPLLRSENLGTNWGQSR